MHSPLGRAANCKRDLDQATCLQVERATFCSSLTKVLVCSPYLWMTVGQASCSGRKISLHFPLAHYAIEWRSYNINRQSKRRRLQVRPAGGWHPSRSSPAQLLLEQQLYLQPRAVLWRIFGVRLPATPPLLPAGTSTPDIFARRVAVAFMGKIQGGPV